jgi:cbb3-type cytochrome oxidase subunit 3
VSRGDAFVLRLSSPEVDLTRSRAMDDRKRAQLRERQLVLDQDDQVAAVLALRHSVKQLESQVAELRLKLAGMPASFPPPPAAKPEPPKVEPPKASPPAPQPTVTAKAEPAKAEPPKVEPPKVEPLKVEPPKVEPPRAEAPKPVEPARALEPPKAAVPKAIEPPKAVEAPRAATAPVEVKRAVTEEEWLRYGLWVLAVLLLFAAGYLAFRLWQRRRAQAEEEAGDVLELEPGATPADDMIVVADEHVTPDLEIDFESVAPAARPEYSADGRRIIDADVELTTRVGSDTDDLRRRYIEERFPEITKGAIALDDADSIVKGARLFYEDGAIARAVELLHFAIERRPSDIKVWLALFEIFRLERLTGEFAALAHRFREAHGASPYWPKVQYFGREIDPGNALYQPAALNTFETIGPAQAKRLAAESTFDPIAENWLGAPMDFENEVLANDLRKSVMAEAGISDGDLLPNPMPALRNVEMFTVA